MRAIDTNVLLRLLVRDQPAQAERADAAIENGAWVSLLVLAEAVWVLKSSFKLSRIDIAKGVEMVLAHEQLSMQDAEVAAKALTAFMANKKAEFSDCLILEIARRAGHAPMNTFDGDFAKLDGVERLVL